MVLTELGWKVIVAVIFGSMAGSCLLTLVVYCACGRPEEGTIAHTVSHERAVLTRLYERKKNNKTGGVWRGVFPAFPEKNIKLEGCRQIAFCCAIYKAGLSACAGRFLPANITFHFLQKHNYPVAFCCASVSVHIGPPSTRVLLKYGQIE